MCYNVGRLCCNGRICCTSLCALVVIVVVVLYFVCVIIVQGLVVTSCSHVLLVELCGEKKFSHKFGKSATFWGKI